MNALRSMVMATIRQRRPGVWEVRGYTGKDVDGVIFIVSPVDDTHHVMFFGFWANGFEINDAHEMDLTELLRQNILLALPMRNRQTARTALISTPRPSPKWWPATRMQP